MPMLPYLCITEQLDCIRVKLGGPLRTGDEACTRSIHEALKPKKLQKGFTPPPKLNKELAR